MLHWEAERESSLHLSHSMAVFLRYILSFRLCITAQCQLGSHCGTNPLRREQFTGNAFQPDILEIL